MSLQHFVQLKLPVSTDRPDFDSRVGGARCEVSDREKNTREAM